ncbi:hypothetical protein BD779DRAFT_1725307 [Infundibulicybe gibba]|nr:hypothetical protein BD779DRAFT_1725307 [Infundibulicybe gibba]
MISVGNGYKNTDIWEYHRWYQWSCIGGTWRMSTAVREKPFWSAAANIEQEKILLELYFGIDIRMQWVNLEHTRESSARWMNDRNAPRLLTNLQEFEWECTGLLVKNDGTAKGYALTGIVRMFKRNCRAHRQTSLGSTILDHHCQIRHRYKCNDVIELDTCWMIQDRMQVAIMFVRRIMKDQRVGQRELGCPTTCTQPLYRLLPGGCGGCFCTVSFTSVVLDLATPYTPSWRFVVKLQCGDPKTRCPEQDSYGVHHKSYWKGREAVVKHPSNVNRKHPSLGTEPAQEPVKGLGCSIFCVDDHDGIPAWNRRESIWTWYWVRIRSKG